MTKKLKTTLKESGKVTRGYSKAKAAFVLEKIEEGMSITAIHRKWPDKCPNATAVFKWARNNQEFKKELDLAYDLYIRSLVDEYDAISSADIDKLYPSLDGKYAFEARRARMNFLQFMILKVSPFLSKQWDTKTTVVHEGLENLGPQLVIANYGAKCPEGTKFTLLTFDTLDKQLLKEKKKALTKFVKKSLDSEWMIGISNGVLITNGLEELELIALLDLTKHYIMERYNSDQDE